MSAYTGGPAFPQTQTVDVLNPESGFVSGLDVSEGGMTLRDYFAAKAMHAYMSDQIAGWGTLELDHAAATAYKVADAMLKAREQ